MPWTPDIANRAGPRYRAITDAIADDVAAGVLAVTALVADRVSRTPGDWSRPA